MSWYGIIGPDDKLVAVINNIYDRNNVIKQIYNPSNPGLYKEINDINASLNIVVSTTSNGGKPSSDYTRTKKKIKCTDGIIRTVYTNSRTGTHQYVRKQVQKNGKKIMMYVDAKTMKGGYWGVPTPECEDHSTCPENEYCKLNENGGDCVNSVQENGYCYENDQCLGRGKTLKCIEKKCTKQSAGGKNRGKK